VKSLLDAVHGGMIYTRRVARLASLIADRLPRTAKVLDVGTGDGALAARVRAHRSDISISGVDVLVRGQTAIPVRQFDGIHLPFEDASFDAVMCVDVLHHAVDAARLLRECGRVARDVVVVKDHLREGILASTTLRVMDWVGNARHGVRLPYNYFSRREWNELIAGADVGVTSWDEALSLYPRPVDWVFGRRLHVLMTLRPRPARATAPRG
jgi:SAM-dependent methyltransferase